MSKVLVIFGATGDLAKERLYPALKFITNLKVIGYGRRPLNREKYNRFPYTFGDFINPDALINVLEKYNPKEVFFYLSLPPGTYIEAIKFIKNNFSSYSPKIALEKPFGTSYKEARKIAELIKTYVKHWKQSGDFYLVDHYLAKPELQKAVGQRIDVDSLSKIELSILETGDVSKRGRFYDEIGVIKDVVQNHLLNTVDLFFQKNNEPNLLEKLKYKRGSLVLGQYKNYLKTEGVSKSSKTPTYFRAQFAFKNIDIVLRGGKALNQSKLLLSVTDKKGKNKKLLDLTGKDKPYLAHLNVIKDFLNGRHQFSLSLESALNSWKVIENVEKEIKTTKLVNYPMGSSYVEIEAF